MTMETWVVLAGAGVIALAALTAALYVRRATARLSAALAATEARLVTHGATLPHDLAAVRERVASSGRTHTERAVWALGRADERMAAAEVSLREWRAASDRLRTDMLGNRGGLLRLRNAARVLVRAIELRREFLG